MEVESNGRNSRFSVAQIPLRGHRRAAPAFLRPKKSRSFAIRGSGREIEIFIPAVEKRSAVRNYARAPLLPVAHAVADYLSSLALSSVPSRALRSILFRSFFSFSPSLSLVDATGTFY